MLVKRQKSDCVQSVPNLLEGYQPYHPEMLDCKSEEDFLQILSADEVRKRSSCDMHVANYL